MCGFPPEYCEFGSSITRCKTWLEETHPDVYPKYYSEGRTEFLIISRGGRDYKPALPTDRRGAYLFQEASGPLRRVTRSGGRRISEPPCRKPPLHLIPSFSFFCAMLTSPTDALTSKIGALSLEAQKKLEKEAAKKEAKAEAKADADVKKKQVWLGFLFSLSYFQ